MAASARCGPELAGCAGIEALEADYSVARTVRACHAKARAATIRAPATTVTAASNAAVRQVNRPPPRPPEGIAGVATGYGAELRVRQDLPEQSFSRFHSATNSSRTSA